jgi:hypothetical protein
MAENPSATVPAIVEKLIKFPGAAEKAQLTVESADHLYREIRIENTLIDEKGHEVSLKSGAEDHKTGTSAPLRIHRRAT